MFEISIYNFYILNKIFFIFNILSKSINRIYDQWIDQGDDAMVKSFIGIEIGSSAYTEFKMRGGEFELTEDGIFLGSVEAEDKGEAIEKIKGLECNRDRVFDRVVVFEVCG